MTKKLDHQAHNNFQISLRSLKFSKIIRKSYKKKQFVFKTKILNFAIPVQKKKQILCPPLAAMVLVKLTFLFMPLHIVHVLFLPYLKFLESTLIKQIYYMIFGFF